MHNYSDMIIHVLIDVPQEATRNNAHSTKCNTGQVDPPIALRKRNLPRLDDGLVCDWIALNAG